MLDAPTLFAVTTVVTGLLGVLLLGVWFQERNIRALAWWGAAYLIGASAVTLWMGPGGSMLSPATPNTLLFIAFGLIWNGARLFHGKSPHPVGLTASAVCWIVAMQFPAFAQSDIARIIFSSVVIAGYTALIARELGSDRRKDARRIGFGLTVPLLHGAVFLWPIPVALLSPPDGVTTEWFALLTLETLIYVVATAFIVVVMAKERVVHIHKTAAMTDPLTGLFNRRAFFEHASAMIARQTKSKGAVAVLAFDLDHFKSINDRFGHAAGDDALRAFAACASSTMRSTDVLGRIGGEEFVAILPGTIADAAMAAERVRAAYELAGEVIAGHVMKSTVSIGVAASLPPAEVQAMLARADVALYQAKKNGRNQVATALDEPPAIKPVEPGLPQQQGPVAALQPA